MGVSRTFSNIQGQVYFAVEFVLKNVNVTEMREFESLIAPWWYCVTVVAHPVFVLMHVLVLH